MSESILSRRSVFYWPTGPALSATQNQVDALVTHFVEEAADPKTLASLTAGGLAYRYGKIGVMSIGSGHVAAMPLRIISTGLGLGSEVTAFEFTNRTLQSFSPSPITGHLSPNLWNWSGPGGWKQALINDTLTFGLLKGAGYLTRESNLVFQHTFSSTAMVAGHQTSAQFGIIPKPEGTLAEQLLHAEITNLQLGAGTSLVHTIAPGISALERGLDLSLQSKGGANLVFAQNKGRSQGSPLQFGPQWALADGIKEGGALLAAPSRDPKKNPNYIMMAAPDDPDSGIGGDKSPSTLPSAGTTERHLSFTTLADLLGVDVSSHQPGQDLAKITLALRTKVMDKISRPEIASKLSADTLHQLRLFVVGGVGDSSGLNRSLQELVEKTATSSQFQAPSQALVPAVPTRPVAIPQEGALIPRPPAVLFLNELPDLFRNPRIVTHHPDGRIQISLRGKTNLSLQDYLDFYQLIFHQAQEFREMLQHLQNQGVDILPLAPRVRRMDVLLRQAAVHIKDGHGDLSRVPLEQVDGEIESFQRDLMAIALRMGWGPPHFAGRLALYGQNVLPPAYEQQRDDLAQPVAPRLILPQRQAGVGEPPAPRPEEPRRIFRVQRPLPVLSPAQKELLTHKQDYEIEVAGLKKYLNFSDFGIYYLFKSESSPDNPEGIHIIHYPPEKGLLGAFRATDEGLIFESAQEPGEPILLQEDLRMEFSIPKGWRGRMPVKVERHPRFLAGEIALQLKRQGTLNAPLEGVLVSVMKEEKAYLKAQEARRHHCRIHNLDNLFGEDPLGKIDVEKALEGISKEDAEKMVREVLNFWASPQGKFGQRTTEFLKALIPKLSHKSQIETVSLLMENFQRRLESEIKEQSALFQNSDYRERILASLKRSSYQILLKILLPSGIDARLAGLRWLSDHLLKSPSVEQSDLNILESLLSSLPPEVLPKILKAGDSQGLKRLILAYAEGLPFVAPIYDRYLQADDPQTFIQLATDRVRYFREGGLLFSRDADHLAFAFGALDNPELLSFEQFVKEVTLEDLPRPFMNGRFKVQVPLVKVAHAHVDKGIVKEAYDAVAKIYRQDLLVKYLEEVLAKPKQNGLSPFRQELPSEKIQESNVIEISEKLMEVLAKGKKNLTPQARDVLQHLAFGVASQSENGRALLPILALYHEKMSSDQLLQVLNALREFYSDAVGDVLKKQEVKLKWVDQMGDRLKKQVDQVKTEAGDFQTIEMVPSKSQTDVFAGYIGEDCTKGRWKNAIKRVDTQVYRMISNKRLVGMVYLKRHVFEDGEVTLILGIEPRARFRVDAKALLDGIIKNLGEIAGRGDYDLILISTSRNERSNRPDMNDAIEKRFEGRAPRIFGESVDGGIFSNNMFHVAWDRPWNLPKGPGPSDSIGDVVSSGAKTTMGYRGSQLPEGGFVPPTPNNQLPWWRRVVR